MKAWAAAVLLALVVPLASFARPSTFSAGVPDQVPSVRGWERIAGDIAIVDPPTRVEYEFYVNPDRPAAYEVVRYRITQQGPVSEWRRYATSEKLQWDLDGHDVRRYECVPAAADGRGDQCRWREMAKGSKEYVLEVPVVLWLYGLHRQEVHASRR
jgi:hypothetical protein